LAKIGEWRLDAASQWDRNPSFIRHLMRVWEEQVDRFIASLY